MNPETLVAFWRDAGAAKWFDGGPAFDAECRDRFEAAHLAASRGDCAWWNDSPDGALGLQLLLDQIPRNIYRGSAHAFATDALARQYARTALVAGLDAQVEPGLRLFLYLPFEHSEAVADQELALSLIAALGDAAYTRYAREHLAVIREFGRFPHRNAVLGRTSTPQERAWLAAGGGF